MDHLPNDGTTTVYNFIIVLCINPWHVIDDKWPIMAIATWITIIIIFDRCIFDLRHSYLYECECESECTLTQCGRVDEFLTIARELKWQWNHCFVCVQLTTVAVIYITNIDIWYSWAPQLRFNQKMLIPYTIQHKPTYWLSFVSCHFLSLFFFLPLFCVQ